MSNEHYNPSPPLHTRVIRQLNREIRELRAELKDYRECLRRARGAYALATRGASCYGVPSIDDGFEPGWHTHSRWYPPVGHPQRDRIDYELEKRNARINRERGE